MVRPDKANESEDQFLVRAERNLKMIRKLETEVGDTRGDLYQLFKKSHFSRQDKEVLSITDRPTSPLLDDQRPVLLSGCDDIDGESPQLIIDAADEGESKLMSESGEMREGSLTDEGSLGLIKRSSRQTTAENDPASTPFDACEGDDNEIKINHKATEKQVINEFASINYAHILTELSVGGRDRSHGRAVGERR